jgi:hypothetical protein
MGKSYTFKYRVVYLDQCGWHSQGWKGKASQSRLEDWRVAMNKSFQNGGNNEHLSQSAGVILHISKARVIRQSDNVVMAETAMPMFEVA